MSRADASRPAVPALLTRVAPWWWALAVPVLVGASALVPASPIRDARTLGEVPEATLVLPGAYVLLAPVSKLLDTLTLLSLRQHVVLWLTLLAVFALWWWRRGRIVPASVTPARRAVRHAARMGLALVGLVAVYAAAILMPRPMAALQLTPEIVAIDFHTHTQHSHDGRWNWTAEDVRRWHADAGYSAAYVTDHRSFDGAREGWANNPALSGQGTVLLPAIEVVWKGEHVNILDADRAYAGILTPSLRDVDEEALRLASSIPGKEPLVIETLPGDLDRMIPARGPGTAGVRAIELVDGAPKGLGQVRRERPRILHLADSLNLALVSGSDSHGWGHVAQAWTLMRLPGWRGSTPDALSDAISNVLRRGGVRATRVVERWIPDTDSGLRLPLTVPIVLWGMLRTLTPEERVMWIVWSAAAVLLWMYRARRRAALAAG